MFKVETQVSVKKNFLPDLLKLGENSKPIPTEGNPDYQTVVSDEIWVVDNVLSKEEAKMLIDLSEKLGYTQALLTTGIGTGILAKDVRDSKRTMADDFETAEYLFKRCKNLVPRACEGGLLLSINERLRFLKYDEPGNNFVKHCDGSFPRNTYEKSVITIQFYLNEDMEGGETTFFDDCFPGGSYACVPKTGRVLFFSGWLHEGSKLKSGVKYTIRTEFMYQWFTSLQADAMMKDGEKLPECGVCGKVPQFVNTSCTHAFLVCGCSPFNYNDDLFSYQFGETFVKEKQGYCTICNKKFKFPPEIAKSLQEKYSTERVLVKK